MRMKVGKRSLAGLLAFLMVFSVLLQLPASVYAEDSGAAVGGGTLRNSETNSGDPAQTNGEATDQEKVEAAVAAFNKAGNLRPVSGTDTDINAVALAQLEKDTTLDLTGVTMQVATTSDEDYIAKDGTIQYVKLDNPASTYVYGKNMDCTFTVTCGAASQETAEKRVQLGWDKVFFEGKIKAEAESLTVEKLLGTNPSVSEITANLTLPQIMGTSARGVFSKITWKSSHPGIIDIEKGSPYDAITDSKIGKVTQPEEDTKVTLTATFSANDTLLNNYIGETPARFATVTKDYEVTVKGTGQTGPTEEELQAILDKYYTVEDLAVFGSSPAEKIDPSNVITDIQLLRYTRVKDEAGTLVFKNKEITVTSDNPAITISGYRGAVDRLAKDGKVNLTITFTRDGVTVSKVIPLQVGVITDAELDAEIVRMELAKANYFAGINDGRYADKDSITGNLRPFTEMNVDGSGNPVWTYDVAGMTGSGIIADGYFENSWEMEGAGYNKYRSSDVSVIAHENLNVTQAESNKTVTITSWLSSQKYRDMAAKHPENKKLQKLYKQEVSVTVTVKGTKGAADALNSKIMESESFLATMVEGTSPGQYPAGAKEALQSAIDSAKAALAAGANLDEAVAALEQALRQAKDSVNLAKATITIVAQKDKNSYDTVLTEAVVSADAATKAGYSKAPEFQKQVTVIDALVVLHQHLYGDAFNSDPTKYLVMDSKGSISTIFGKKTYSLGYFVNNEMPVYAEDPSKGSVANDTVLKTHDTLNVFLYNSPYYAEKYVYFEKKAYEAVAGTPVTVQLQGFYAMMDRTPKTEEGATIVAKNTAGEKVAEATTDADGKATLTIAEQGDYTLTVSAIAEDETWGDYFVAPYSKLTVKAPTPKPTFTAKSQWVSKYENNHVTFNWTGTPNNNLATAWDVQYRTKMIGTGNAWGKWISSREKGNTLSKRIYLKPNHTIEFKAKHETDTAYLRSVFTTPAGGKYQSVTQCQVKVTATAGGATFKKGNKAAAGLKVGTNINGASGNVITIKKGQTVKITPNHVYPHANYRKYPRLYPNHAWYDVADSSTVSLTGTNSTAGMKDGVVTIKGLKAGTTTVKITSCNGRGATLTIVVK